jgi:hypothetical protein
MNRRAGDLTEGFRISATFYGSAGVSMFTSSRTVRMLLKTGKVSVVYDLSKTGKLSKVCKLSIVCTLSIVCKLTKPGKILTVYMLLDR